jgi:SPP1 gp7 family putative phage head morphogenesis protein
MEQQAARRLTEQHRRAFRDLRPHEEALVRALKDRAAQGLPVDRSWLSNEPQWRRFVDLVKQGTVLFGAVAVEEVRAQQRVFAERAVGQDTTRLIAAQIGDELAASVSSVVPADAVIELVGQLQRASPLLRLEGIGRSREVTTMVDGMGRELIRGVARGHHSRRIASAIHQRTGIPLTRARTIARTESFRAHREASRMGYQRNRAVDQWRWTAGLGARTCAACWAMHGRLFDTDTPMGTHPNCRCTMTPVVAQRVREEFGMGPGPVFVDGPARFADLPAAMQRQILGPGRFEQYQGGVPLGGFVQERRTREWGVTRTVSPVGA